MNLDGHQECNCQHRQESMILERIQEFNCQNSWCLEMYGVSGCQDASHLEHARELALISLRNRQFSTPQKFSIFDGTKIRDFCCLEHTQDLNVTTLDVLPKFRRNAILYPLIKLNELSQKLQFGNITKQIF